MTAGIAIRNPLWALLQSGDGGAAMAALNTAIGVPHTRCMPALSLPALEGLRLLVGAPAVTNDTINQQESPMPDVLQRAPIRRHSHRAAMWRVMRVLKRFDLVQLCMAAEVSEAAARVYVSALLRAGILRRMARGHAASGQRSLYALTGTFGPLTPVIRQRRAGGRTTTTVIDPNTGTTREISAHPPLPPLF